MSETTRALIYRAALALLVVGTVYGFINEEQATAVGNAIGALIALLASVNTSVKGSDS